MQSSMRTRVTALMSTVALLWSLISIAAPTPALASCVVWPGTNEIVITWSDQIDIGTVVIPGTPAGLVGICVDVQGSPNPQVADPYVDVCGNGTPCFVVSWDGVSTDPVTVSVTIYVDGTPTTFGETIQATGAGKICIQSGTNCTPPP